MTSIVLGLFEIEKDVLPSIHVYQLARHVRMLVKASIHVRRL